MSNTPNVDTAQFAEIVAGWERQVSCEANTKSGDPCNRPATLLVNVHGCERITSCTQHYRAYVAKCAAEDASGGRKCYFCDLVARFEDSHTAVRL